jgi:hypothetical protein
MSLTDLTNNADIIVSAKVTSVESRWVRGEGGRIIVTFAKIKIERAIKGEIGSDELTLETPGGQIGDTVQFVTHSASLRLNEETILFLRKNPLRVVGGSQGKMSIENQSIYYQSKKIPKDIFLQKIASHVLNPLNGIEFESISNKLKALPNSKKQEANDPDVLPNSEPQKLIRDPNSSNDKENEIGTLNQQPQKLKAEPNHLQKEKDNTETLNQQPQKLRVDPNSQINKEEDSKPVKKELQKLRAVERDTTIYRGVK